MYQFGRSIALPAGGQGAIALSRVSILWEKPDYLEQRQENVWKKIEFFGCDRKNLGKMRNFWEVTKI